LNDSPTLIQNSKNIWDAAINPSNPAVDNFLHIEHDNHYQTVYNLTDYMLASLYSHGYKAVTLGECLGDPAANWYRGNVTVPTTGQTVSTDGSCSASVTCLGSAFGNCCSQYGFCGTGATYVSKSYKLLHIMNEYLQSKRRPWKHHHYVSFYSLIRHLLTFPL